MFAQVCYGLTFSNKYMFVDCCFLTCKNVHYFLSGVFLSLTPWQRRSQLAEHGQRFRDRLY